MPDNMKCGRLRSSNCFVVFFPSLSPFLPDFSRVRVYRVRSSRPFSSLLSVLFFASLGSFPPFANISCNVYQRIYTIPRLSSVPFLLLSDFYSTFPDFFISFSCMFSLCRFLSLDYFIISYFCTLSCFSPLSRDYPIRDSFIASSLLISYFAKLFKLILFTKFFA